MSTKLIQQELIKDIPAAPAKTFFVEMITRDIELQDAILDLLDNCVDGIRRSDKVDGEKPYQGYYAKISFSENQFTIEDNCGGIPLDIAQKYAFMMGRPATHKETTSGTIGVYGIGMKRAIFKMGRSCVVHSHTKKDTFQVEITKEWLDDDKDWVLGHRKCDAIIKKHGTVIRIGDLNKNIKKEFAADSVFSKEFHKMVRDAYSLLLEKGFKVTVNGEVVTPKLPSLLWDLSAKTDALRPYIFTGNIYGVNVFLAVGFREKPETDPSNGSNPHYRSEDAGWTIACNDRVILPNDKSKQTGWGWGGVPSYHTQFIAIGGVVTFDGHPSELPMTTTKRGVDANSPLYTLVRERMQAGIQHFTDFTNDWKGLDVSELFKKADKVSLSEIMSKVQQGAVKLAAIKGDGTQRQVAPHLPTRPRDETDKLISFRRDITTIKVVSKFLFDSEDMKPSDVGAECFDFVLKKAK